MELDNRSGVKKTLNFFLRVLAASAILELVLLPANPAGAAGPVMLGDPTVAIEEGWVHKKFGDPTEYVPSNVDGRTAIRAIGRNSASGLFRDVAYRISEHPWLEWSWRVEKLQGDADIRVKKGHDFAASIFLIFGRKGFFRSNVPTLGYVWTSGRIAKESMVVSPYHSGKTRMFVVESGTERLGQWLRERRNVVEDFREAFGQEPPDKVEILEVFTDNDQTGQPVEAYYGFIRAIPK